MRIAICDDLPEFANKTEELLLKYDKNFLIDVFYEPARLIETSGENHYDLFIFDIEMPQLSGLELAKEIRSYHTHTPIIFLTSYKEYMEDVFSLHTFDYLLKPIEEKRLFAVMDRVLEYLNLNDAKLSFTFNRQSYHLLFSDILYFEKNKRKVIIHTKEQGYEMLMITKELLDLLDHNFIQIHNSFIINMKHLKRLKNDTLIMQNGDELPISRKFSKSVKDTVITRIGGIM